MPWRFRAKTDRKLSGETPLVRKLLGLEPADGSESSAAAGSGGSGGGVGGNGGSGDGRRRKPEKKTHGMWQSAGETRIRRSFDLR